jgi:Holliday junction resolvase RusA-like endonuclease
MRFAFDPPPSLNRLYRYGKGRVYLSDEGKTYKEYVKIIALHQGAETLEGALEVSVWAFGLRPDADNLLKILIDSLKGVAMIDDAQITSLHVYKLPDDGDKRVEVEVNVMEVIPG